MTANSEQIQIVKKLGKMEQELNALRSFNKELLKRLEELEFENYYPPESKIKKSYTKKFNAIEKRIKQGHAIHYKTFEDFAKDVS